jgi:hypothetical protein
LISCQKPSKEAAKKHRAFFRNMSLAPREVFTMPDAASKVTVFFEAQGGTAPTGWTENWWSSQADLPTIVNSFIANYVPARTPLLGVGARIQSVRATLVQTPAARVSYVEFLPGIKSGEGNLFTNSPADDYDPTQVDLLIRMSNLAGKHRQFWLGGLPDSQTDQLLQQGITGAFINSPAYKQWIAAIGRMPIGIRYKTSSGPPATYAFATLTTFLPIMVRNRKRGRPFYLFRGRRLA